MTSIHVSPDGSDRNDGSNDTPLGSIGAGIDAASPGDHVVVHGGDFAFDSQFLIEKGGSSTNPLVIRAADGTTPRLDFRGNGEGVKIYGDYVHFVGFEVTNSAGKGINPTRADNVVIENCDVHDCHLWGIMANGGDGVVFRNCDSHHNDGNPENSDGFNMTAGGGEPATNGLIEGCRSWANGDDGYDFWVSNGHTIRDCWAWDNGRGSSGDGNGFKLGGENQGGGHRVERCAAYNNSGEMGYGFDWNTGGDPIEVVNCTAVNNDVNYRFRENGDTVVNNISYQGDVQIGSNTTEEANSWNQGIDDPQFRSTDPASGDFLCLAESSPCCDAGVDVGLDYNGDAPDLGAFEYGGGGGAPPVESQPVDGEATLLASDARTNAGTYLESYHDGFNDQGYVNFEPDSGAYARWSLDVQTPGTYDYRIRYANGGEIDRTAVLTAGDVQQDVTFPRTGEWPAYDTVTGTVEFAPGEQDLVIRTTGEDAGNVDRITLVPREGNRLPVDGEATLLASDASTNADSHLESEHDGFNDQGYVNFEPGSGAYARWSLDVQTPGTYEYRIRYANGSEMDRSAVLTADDVQQNVTFQRTGEWPAYDTITGTLDLASGEVDFAIQTTGEDAGNVDQITLVPADDDTGSTPGDGAPSGDTTNHGYSTPEAGTNAWHVPLNENFEAIDRGVPVVDTEAAMDAYTPTERTLYVAIDTGTIYVGDGSGWSEVGLLG